MSVDISAGLRLACFLAVLSVNWPSFAADTDNPLARVDTSSPRATLKSVLDAVGKSAHLLQQLSTSRDEELALKLDEALERAAGTLDLSEVPPGWLDDTAGESILQLQEILDRIPLPPLDTVPDAERAKAESMTLWTLQETEIAIALVQQGPELGNWLFSPETVAQTEEFYNKVEGLPYRADALVGELGPMGGTFDYYRNLPEFDSVIPLEFVFQLSEWMWVTARGQPAWKWLGTFAVFAIALIVLVVVNRLSDRAASAPGRREIGRYLWRLSLPVTGFAVVATAEHMVDEEIGLTGLPVSYIETATGVLSLLFLGWTVFAIGNVVASTINTSERLDPDVVYAGLIRISAPARKFCPPPKVSDAYNLGSALRNHSRTDALCACETP